MFVKFHELPIDAKVWIYIGDRKMTANEKNDLVGKIEPFLSRWKSEGKEFKSSYEILEDQILVVGGVSEGFALSGCTMDALKKTVLKWDEALLLNLTVVPKFCYRGDKSIVCRNQAEFKDDIRKGLVNEKTKVFDNTILSMEEYRKGIEFPIQKCWHYRLLELAQKKLGAIK